MAEAQVNPGEYYIGKSNTTCYQLKSTHCVSGLVGPVKLTPVNKMELQLLGTLYSSDDDPAAFNWSVDPENGLLELSCGLLSGVSPGLDIEPELVIYDPSNTDGVAFRMPAIVTRAIQ